MYSARSIVFFSTHVSLKWLICHLVYVCACISVHYYEFISFYFFLNSLVLKFYISCYWSNSVFDFFTVNMLMWVNMDFKDKIWNQSNGLEIAHHTCMRQEQFLIEFRIYCLAYTKNVFGVAVVFFFLTFFFLIF